MGDKMIAVIVQKKAVWELSKKEEIKGGTSWFAGILPYRQARELDRAEGGPEWEGTLLRVARDLLGREGVTVEWIDHGVAVA